MKRIKDFLESKFLIFIIFSIGLFFWILNQSSIGLCILSVIAFFILIFCDYVNNIFAVLIYILFFIESFFVKYDIVSFILCAVLVSIGIITFLIKNILIKKRKVKKGQLFWLFVISTIAYLFGGIFSNFHIDAFFIILALSLISYTLYFLAINFTNDFKRHFMFILIGGSILIISEFILLLLYENLNLFFAISHRSFIWIGSANINEAAIYLTLGMIACFMLGFKSNRDILYFCLASVIELFILFTYCRIIILLSAVAFLILTIVSIRYSNNKLYYLYCIDGLIIIASIYIIFNTSDIIKMFETLLNKIDSGLNGRGELWAWCWQKFKENKLFGYGFVSDEPVPTIINFISSIPAHDTFLQWLTSLGIIGTIAMLVCTIIKYYVSIINTSKYNFFIIVMIMLIELDGIVDQAPMMNFFIYIIPFFLIALLENDKETYNTTTQIVTQTKKLQSKKTNLYQ